MSKEKKRKDTYLLIDGNNFAHRAYHTMGMMKFGGKNVGIIFGMMNMLGSLHNRYRPKGIYVFWDGGRHPERLKIDPEYKQRERKIGFDKDDFERQLKQVRKLIFFLGLPQLHKAQREADDFIHAKQKTLSQRENTKVIICSGDKDFRQDVKKNVHIHDDHKGLITPLNFHRLFGVEPYQFVDYLAMLGDDSDNIKGISGIGVKTALALLEKYDTLEAYATTGLKDKWYDRIHAQIGTPKSLIDLEWFRKRFKLSITEDDYYKGQKKPKHRPEKYAEYAMKFGLKQHRKPEYIAQFNYRK